MVLESLYFRHTWRDIFHCKPASTKGSFIVSRDPQQAYPSGPCSKMCCSWILMLLCSAFPGKSIIPGLKREKSVPPSCKCPPSQERNGYTKHSFKLQFSGRGKQSLLASETSAGSRRLTVQTAGWKSTWKSSQIDISYLRCKSVFEKWRS